MTRRPGRSRAWCASAMRKPWIASITLAAVATLSCGSRAARVSDCSSANPSVGNSTGYWPAASVVPCKIRPSGSCTSIGRPASGCAVLILGDQRGLDRLAAIEHCLLQVERKRDRLELIRVDLEAAGEVALAGLKDPDAVSAGRCGAIERELFMERAEIRERDGMRGDQPAAAVGHFEAIDRLGHVGVLAAGDFADHAADRDLVAGAIGGAIRVDISARGQPLGDLRRARPAPSRQREGRPEAGSSAGRCRRGAGSSHAAARRRPRSRRRERSGRLRKPALERRRGPCRFSCPGRRQESGRARS